MTLFIIDQGQRIQTPVRSILKDRKVVSTQASKATHASAKREDELHADGEKFTLYNKSGVDHSARRPSGQTYNESGRASDNSSKRLLADKIMSSPVQTISQTDTAKNAWHRMSVYEISHLVVTNDDQQPIGVISETDLLRSGTDSPVSISAVFSDRLVAAAPETDVAEIAATFVDYEINSMPIIDSAGSLVGIICRTDLLRLLITGQLFDRWA